MSIDCELFSTRLWVSLIITTLMRLRVEWSELGLVLKKGMWNLYCRGKTLPPQARSLFPGRVWLVLWDTDTQTNDGLISFRSFILAFGLCFSRPMLNYEIMQGCLSLVPGIQGTKVCQRDTHGGQSCVPCLPKATMETKEFKYSPQIPRNVRCTVIREEMIPLQK